jgi:hypothetical protein
MMLRSPADDAKWSGLLPLLSTWSARAGLQSSSTSTISAGNANAEIIFVLRAILRHVGVILSTQVHKRSSDVACPSWRRQGGKTQFEVGAVKPEQQVW